MLVRSYLPPVLTTQQLANALQLKPRTIRRMAAQGALPPPVRLGRVLRWDRQTILELLGCL